MVITQGDVFWVNLKEPSGSEPGYKRPFVVIQSNTFNRSNINTVVVCALTSNTSLANAPGNVIIKKGESNIPKSSVVNISQILTLDKLDLGEKIGTLSKSKVLEIVNGIHLLISPKLN